MACIKSVFFRIVQTLAHPEDNFLKLAQLVKIWTMRPTVDNVYFASAFVIPLDAYTAHVFFTCGTFMASGDVGFFSFPISTLRFIDQHIFHA